jgi:glycosyltransferase involved in cell wall biosynthesis
MPRLVEAVPNAHLVVVGEGSEAAALQAQAAALPAPSRGRVIFTGRREDVAALTADLDVAVLPSLREAQGISILEAMARGVPVVASRVGGIPEVITDGVDGLLVEPSSPEEIAAALTRLAREPELLARLGEAGRRTVAERFSIDAMVHRVEAVYEEELARAGISREGAAASRDGASRPRDRGALEVPPL